MATKSNSTPKSDSYISLYNIEKLVKRNLTVKGPIKKTVEQKDGPNIQYNIFELEYNFTDNPDSKLLKPFLLELFALDAKWGLNEVQDTKTKAVIEGKWSFSTKLDETKEEDILLMQVLDWIYDVFVAYLVSIKYKGWSAEFIKSSMKRIYSIPILEDTGERNPEKSIHFKTTIEKWNRFTFPDGSPCDIKNLKDLAFTVIPLFKFQLFSSSMMPLVIQRKLQSGVITSISQKGASNKQEATCNRLQDANPELAEQVKESYMKLTGAEEDVSKKKEDEIKDLNKSLADIANLKFPTRETAMNDN